jgi:hypothetical protein
MDSCQRNIAAYKLRCLIPRFDGVTCSLEWKEALWDRYVMAAPRTLYRQHMPACVRGHARRPSSNTTVAGYERSAEP